METDHKSTQEIQLNSIFFLFFLSLSFTETALGPIWFGFSMNYHGLDPVSAVKAPKMSQLYPYPPYEYSTTCSLLPIVFSFVLVSETAGDNVMEEDVAKGSGIDILSDSGLRDTLQWTQRSLI